MEITIELFATLTQYLPPGTKGKSGALTVQDGATVAQVLKDLGVPEEMPFTTLVNGHHTEPDQVLKPGDRLSAFPPLAGGCGESSIFPPFFAGQSPTLPAL
jgi:molybdopterin converting factor small subunit